MRRRAVHGGLRCPDVEVIPTIEGIRTGRDEVLEEAIRRIHSVVR
jgi:hypothetical protein